MFANNIKKLKIIPILLFIFITIYIFLTVKDNGITDDKYFSEVLQNRSLFEFLKYRYETWSTRLAIESVLVLTINHKLIYKLIISLCFFNTVLFLTKIGGSGRRLNGIMVFFCAVLLLSIPNPVLTEVIWWVTGAYNYLMPAAFALPALYIYFFREKFSVFVRLLSLLLLIPAFSSEQILICFVLPLIIIQTIKNKDFSFYNILFFLVSIGYVIFVIISPGNKFRFFTSMSFYYPDHIHLNFVDKLALGFDRINECITTFNTPLFVLCVTLIIIMTLRNYINNRNIVCVTIIILFFIFSVDKNISLPIFSNKMLDFSSSYRFTNFFPYLFTSLFISSLLSLAVSICRNSNELFNTFVILLLGFGSVLAVGFNPTVYASGNRMLFFLDLAFVYVVIYLLFSFFPVKNKDKQVYHNASLGKC